MGWASKTNGERDISTVDIAVVVLVARSNTLDVLRPLVPLVLDALVNPKRGAVTLNRPEAGRQTDTQR